MNPYSLQLKEEVTQSHNAEIIIYHEHHLYTDNYLTDWGLNRLLTLLEVQCYERYE